jgi:putative glutamine amidotransferase
MQVTSTHSLSICTLGMLLFTSIALCGGGKPIIGINLEVSGETTSTGTRLSLGSDYIDAVTSAGGIPILLPALTSMADVSRHVQLCDGFVFTGGRDINPACYGQQPNPANKLLHPRRENYDLRLIREVLRAKKPILAVCLGCQELNVALGGTLIQDIPSETTSSLDHHQGETRHEIAHEIFITTGSRLANLLSTTTLEVNSVHHQSCGRPGRGVLYTARAMDGIIESFEVKNQPFAVAVQWHPEAITHYPGHLKLYRELVRAAGKPADRSKRPLRKPKANTP